MNAEELRQLLATTRQKISVAENDILRLKKLEFILTLKIQTLRGGANYYNKKTLEDAT